MGSLCFWAGQDNAVGYKAYKMAYPYIAPSPVETMVSESAPMERGVFVEHTLASPRTVANDWEAGLLI